MGNAIKSSPKLRKQILLSEEAEEQGRKLAKEESRSFSGQLDYLIRQAYRERFPKQVQ